MPDSIFHVAGFQDTARQEVEAKGWLVIVFLHLALNDEKVDDFFYRVRTQIP